jgi:hypothetical protein
VFVCGGCDGLALSVRKDQTCCSSRCRVRFNRNRARVDDLKRSAAESSITVASILQGAAIHSLCPELGDRILAGTLSWDAAMATAAGALIALVHRPDYPDTVSGHTGQSVRTDTLSLYRECPPAVSAVCLSAEGDI